MNERIRELAREAGLPTYNPEGIPTKLEKFAELIIRECIGCCEQVISDPVPESVDSWLNGGEQCIQEIKQRMMPNLKECMMIVEGFTIEQEVALDDYQEYEASAVLKEHFGVE